MAGESDKFEVYQDKRGEWRWRRKASNGQIVGAASEGYTSRADAEANMNRGPNPKDKWEFYEDKRGEWRWRRKASNGQIVGAASEGYTRRADAEANAARQGWSA
ncbi:YegP family protein [Pikeienuella sp. HZG-20]|uniref:YegP family protein n=1 Tax=Paludibacillus litoralis TaxID=3133267 RepID=UPI0030EB487B